MEHARNRSFDNFIINTMDEIVEKDKLVAVVQAELTFRNCSLDGQDILTQENRWLLKEKELDRGYHFCDEPDESEKYNTYPFKLQVKLCT